MVRLTKRMAEFGKKAFRTSLDKLAKGLGWRLRQLYDQGLYRLTYMHRGRLRNSVFIGVTGSAGKTTAKDFIASILERHLSKGRKNPGSLNWPEDMVRVVLGTRRSDACVTEISAHGPGMMDLPLALVRPTVGVVTNIGSDHFSAFKSRDAIADEKSKLIRSLPRDGVAILNADDSRVLAMRSLFQGRTVTFGLAGEAMLRGDAIQSVWPDRLSLAATWNGESVRVQTQLCGTHWTPTVLAALATGVALGVPLTVAAEAVASDVRQCILVHDDLALPIGAVRARIRSSDGGHRGVRSILQAFQDDKFRRVKIGVGQPREGQSVIDYVLTPFPAEQHAAVADANRTAADRIVELMRQ